MVKPHETKSERLEIRIYPKQKKWLEKVSEKKGISIAQHVGNLIDKDYKESK